MEAFNSFINYIKFEKRYSDHTVRAYTDDISQFDEYLNQSQSSRDTLSALRDDLRNWALSLMNQGMSPRTLRRKMASLNSFYKYCLKKKWIQVNPATDITLPKIKRKLPEFLNHSSVDFLFTSPQFNEGFSGLRDCLVLELFYATGIRLAELIGLSISSVSFEKKEIRVLGKRNKERIIPVSSKILELLTLYIKTCREEFPNLDHENLILTNKGEPAYPKMIQRLVSGYLNQVTTLEKKSPHVLRHTFATHMLNNGADLNAVKELLGHSSLAATEIYTHNTYEKLKSIYKQAHPRA